MTKQYSVLLGLLDTPLNVASINLAIFDRLDVVDSSHPSYPQGSIFKPLRSTIYVHTNTCVCDWLGLSTKYVSGLTLISPGYSWTGIPEVIVSAYRANVGNLSEENAAGESTGK